VGFFSLGSGIYMYRMWAGSGPTPSGLVNKNMLDLRNLTIAVGYTDVCFCAGD